LLKSLFASAPFAAGVVVASLMPAAPATASTPSGSPIVIGQLATLTGPPEFANPYAGKILSAWVSTVNAEGGIHGHPVKLVTVDDQGSTSVAPGSAKTLVNDHIVALVGENAFATETAWSPILTQAHIPVIGGAAYYPEWTASTDFFPVSYTVYPESKTNLTLGSFKQEGVKKYGMVVDSTNPAAAYAGQQAKKADPSLPITDINPAQPSYTANCLVMQQAGVQGIYLSATSLILTHLAQDCAQQGYHPKIQVGDTAIDTPSMFGSSYAQGTEASVFEYPYVLDNSPASRQFHAAMNHYVPGLFKSDDAQEATLIWTAAQLFQTAATNASDPTTSAGILQGLYKIKNDNLGGLVGEPLTFTAGKPASPNHCTWTMAIQHDHLVTLDHGKATCTS
jgi:branched-chain amino acid transport system substrate-binding protein